MRDSTPLDRLALLKLIDAYRELGETDEAISELLNAVGATSPDGQPWTPQSVAAFDEYGESAPEPGLEMDWPSLLSRLRDRRAGSARP